MLFKLGNAGAFSVYLYFKVCQKFTGLREQFWNDSEAQARGVPAKYV
jgi:hypothetical protein